MSQSNKKSNKLFYILLVLVVLLSLFATFILIYFTNKANDKDEIVIPSDNDTTDVVAESDTLTVYKKYPINPLEYTYLKENSSVITKISGLKNKEIENKINERISQNEDCRLQASFSNILSVTCTDENINIDLTTGNDIKLEELFQKGTNIDENLAKGIFDYVNGGSFFQDLGQTVNYYSNIYYDNYHDDQDYSWEEFLKDYFDAEAFILKELEQFKKSFFIEWDSLGYISTLSKYNNYLSFEDFYESIAIYDRFLTDENIFENDIKEYFYPLVTNIYILDDNYYYTDFAKEKIFLEYQTYFYAVEKELSLPKQNEMNNKLFNYIVNNLEKSNEYQYNYYLLFINKNDENSYYVEIQYNTMNLDKSAFEDLISSSTKSKKIYSTIKTKTNLFIDKNGNITIKDDNPYEYFNDFENKLYDYFINDMEEYCEINKWNSECYFRESLSNTEELKEKLNQFSFAIDEESQMLYLYYVEYYYSEGNIFSLQIPFNKLNKVNTDEVETDENIAQ